MRTRLYVAGVLIGLAALALTVVVVFAFGRHNPSPPSLRDEPNPAIPGEILYLNQDSCFTVARASGESEQQRACLPRGFGGRLYWLDEETAGVLQFGSSGPTLVEVDLATGAETNTGRTVNVEEKPGPIGVYGGAYAPDGTYAFFDEDGGLYFLENGVRVKVADFDTAKYNQPQIILWSPDSQWLLAQYYPRRADGPELWVISRDGQTRGTLTKDAGPIGFTGAAWRIDGVGVEPPAP